MHPNSKSRPPCCWTNTNNSIDVFMICSTLSINNAQCCYSLFLLFSLIPSYSTETSNLCCLYGPWKIIWSNGCSNLPHIKVKSFLVLAIWVDRCTLVPTCVVSGDGSNDHPGTCRFPFIVHQLLELGKTKKITYSKIIQNLMIWTLHLEMKCCCNHKLRNANSLN